MKPSHAKKIRPADAAKAFLNHKLNLLTEDIRLDANADPIIGKEKQACYHFKPTSTYRDLRDYFLWSEFSHIAGELCDQAKQRNDTETAEKIDLLRAVLHPPELGVRLFTKTPEEAASLLAEYRALEKQVDALRVMSKFFATLEETAAGRPLSFDGKNILIRGYKILDITCGTLKMLIGQSAIPGMEGHRNMAQKGMDLHALFDDEHMIDSGSRAVQENSELKDRWVAELSIAFESLQEFAQQLEQVQQEAKKLLGVLTPGMAR